MKFSAIIALALALAGLANAEECRKIEKSAFGICKSFTEDGYDMTCHNYRLENGVGKLNDFKNKRIIADEAYKMYQNCCLENSRTPGCRDAMREFSHTCIRAN